MAKQQDCHHQENRRGRKGPNENLADAPADPVRWQQEPGTDLSHVRDQEQESKRCKVDLPRYQCHGVDHRKKPAADAEDGAGTKGLSRNGMFPQRDGRKSGHRSKAQHQAGRRAAEKCDRRERKQECHQHRRADNAAAVTLGRRVRDRIEAS